MRKYVYYDDNGKVLIITRHKRIGEEYVKHVLSQRKSKKQNKKGSRKSPKRVSSDA